jgi:hypothetical protein
MATHVRTWPGSGCITLTDMANAGKRGRTCRTVRLSVPSWGGWAHRLNCDGYDAARECAESLAATLAPGTVAADFDDVAGVALFEVAKARAAGANAALVEAHDGTIRGVDAPREPLTAGVEGVWSAEATEGGVTLRDLRDVNQWTEITPSSKQTAARAYELARKVWGRVAVAPTRYEASKILTAAGCKLHGFCGMD